MRIWLGPEKVAERGMTASDVVNAIREQNAQVAAGVIGQPPMPKGVAVQLTVNAQGRLIDEAEFGNIVIKSGMDGQVTRVRDVARVELAGLDYRIVFDTTGFTRESIRAVLHTLVEAMILVVLVVVIFLQSWRASLIPLLAVPVSLIGTFAAMSAFGFSLNNLSLFGLVLAIGIVVDDAIVVVENVERLIATGLAPRDATRRAIDAVSGPGI